MKRLFTYLLRFGCAACLLLSSAHAAPKLEELYLGSVAMDVPAAMVDRLTPLTAYLSKKSGIKVSFRASSSLDSAVNSLGNNFTQIAYLTPVAYIEAQQKFMIQPLVSPLTYGKTSFNLVVAVHQDSRIQTLADLNGKSFALGDEKALLQRAVMVNGGIHLNQFSRFGFLKHYDNIAKAILNRDFDAGILKDTIYEKFALQGLRVIYTSPALPPYLFAVNKKIPPQTVSKLRAAFLSLKSDTEDGRMILSQLDQGYDGFVVAQDEDYDVVRKLIAPFQKLAQ